MRPTLKVGQRVRLRPDGPVWEVVRVTFSAAYLRGYDERDVAFDDVRTGERVEFVAKRTRVVPFAPTAAVYPE